MTEEQKRNAFELAMKELGYGLHLYRKGDGYFLDVVEDMWRLWQTAWKLRTPPDGLALVPKEPTPEMLKAMVSEGYDNHGSAEKLFMAVYKEALAAAPSQEEVK